MKRALLAFLAFGVVLAAVAGFAATMNVGGSSLGAGTGSVTKCDDVNVAWGAPTWNGTAFTVGSVTITEDNSDEGADPVNSCNGKAVTVRVGSSSVTGAFTGSTTGAMSITAVPASSVSAVDIVVS